MTSTTLIEQTRACRKGFFQEHQELFARLSSEDQAPQILFIGCDDSRVIPEAIMGAKPGDLFVLRNVANVIPPYGVGERAAGAALEFAVRYLQVQNIILCGHTDCGGIKALDLHLDHLDEPHLARWVEYIRPAQTQVDARGVDAENRHRAIVEQNVLLQLEHLRSYDVVRNGLQTEGLTLHGWVYDLSTGRVSFWDVDADRFVDESELELNPPP
jgi:carbonic anhydrase